MQTTNICLNFAHDTQLNPLPCRHTTWNSQFQGTPLNVCFRNKSFTRVNMKIIAKRFSSSSVGVLLEKVIRKMYEMFWHETFMRKPFVSKATCSSTKKEFLHILFP